MRSRRLVATGAAVVGTVVVLLGLAATPAVAADTVSLFAPDSTPADDSFDDPAAYDLGVRFTSDVDGVVTGVRFYKGLQNTGEHTGSLWSGDGTQLATATFTGETESGWQTVTFGTAVAITAGTSYVASYHTSVGFYAVNLNGFASGLDAGPLHVPPGGGVFRAGAGFPDQTLQHNYWVDIVFVPNPPPTTAVPTTAAPTTTQVTTSTTQATTASSSATTSPGTQLPVTGIDVGIMAGVGALMLVGGVVVLVVGRRRRDRTDPTTT